jgi:hypothetical protein
MFIAVSSEVVMFNRRKKTVENRNSFYQDNWINQYRLYRTAHYSLGSKCLWEFLVLNLKAAIHISINDYTSCTPE